MIIVGRTTPGRMFRMTIFALFFSSASALGSDGWQGESGNSWREVEVSDGRPGFNRIGN